MHFSLLWATVLLLASFGPAVQALDTDSAKLLKECYNEGYKDELTTFQSILKEVPTRLHLHHVYTSSKPKSALNLTVFTTVTPGRLDALEAQCRSWKRGPLAAALYVPLKQASVEGGLSASSKGVLKHVDNSVSQVFARVDADADACHLAVVVLYELYAEDIVGALLPINTLRNAALLAVDTPLTAMVDVDLLVSTSLSHELHDTSRFQDMMYNCTDERRVIVLPAFETDPRLSIDRGKQLAEKVAACPKSELEDYYRSGAVTQFGYAGHVNYAPGHAATDYARWFSTNTTYRIVSKHAQSYEPWFVAHRAMLPEYDVRYRGYGFNKIVQVRHVATLFYRFVTHPAAFVVHSPHHKSGARRAFLEGKNLTLAKYQQQQQQQAGKVGDVKSVPIKMAQQQQVAGTGQAQVQRSAQAAENQAYYELVSGLVRSFHEEVEANNTASLVTDPQTQRCRRVLPWWSATEAEMQAVRLRQDQLEMSRPAVRTAGDGVTLTWFERRRRAKLLRQARQQARQQQQQPAAQQGLVAGGAAGRLTHRAWLRR